MKERFSPFRLRFNHLYLRFRVDNVETLFDPLFLSFSEQIFFTTPKLCLSVVFGNNDSDKDIHDEEVPKHDDENEENDY